MGDEQGETDRDVRAVEGASLESNEGDRAVSKVKFSNIASRLVRVKGQGPSRVECRRSCARNDRDLINVRDCSEVR